MIDRRRWDRYIIYIVLFLTFVSYLPPGICGLDAADRIVSMMQRIFK